MTDRPIIFSASMVMALLRGRKTQTRRLLYLKRKVKNGMIPGNATMIPMYPPGNGKLSSEGFPTDIRPDEFYTLSGWQKVAKDDRLWVREAFRVASVGPGSTRGVVYLADEPQNVNFFELPDGARCPSGAMNRPSIHMPRWTSRITLIVESMKIERVQAITMESMIAEGLMFTPRRKAEHVMSAALRVSDELLPKWEKLWREINGDASWEANPWVVAISFKVVQRNIDEIARAAA